MDNLQQLPKLRDSVSYLYFEHAVIEQEMSSIVVISAEGRTPVPVSSVTCIFLGPGVSITHAAVKAAADCGCMLVWCGERAAKFYAFGSGETRSAKNILIQARLCMEKQAHMRVVRRMYEIRFPKMDCSGMTLQQIRGLEGIRVRKAYQTAAQAAGISWSGRTYRTGEWKTTDLINRALSAANAVLYSVCQAAVISLGYSTALGFVHTGKMLSFVYDIGDLYKAETTIPAAFEAASSGEDDVEHRVRTLCRRQFHRIRLMERIADDISWIFEEAEVEKDDSPVVGDLWDNEAATLAGGKNHATEAKLDDCTRD